MKKPLSVVLLLLILGLGWLALDGTGQQSAPDSSFVLLDGKRQNTSDFRGRVLLVNFWATSCTTCVAEMPELVATHQKYQSRGFDTLAVAMSYDPPSYVVNFSETR
ncbi:MAG: TlpA disulfide reductase family protein, partial [Hylemonella sp.]